jgi:hypothetical protein
MNKIKCQNLVIIKEFKAIINKIYLKLESLENSLRTLKK